MIKRKNGPDSSNLSTSNKEISLAVETGILQKAPTTPLRSHIRSQSLGDISNIAEHRDETDRWRMLIEQRKRTMSKLKGLVIPENVIEKGATAGHVIDIPEIKTNDVFDIAGIAGSIPLDQPKLLPSSVSSVSCVKTILETGASNIPKYSPAFKRRGLQIYGAASGISAGIVGNSRQAYLNKTRELSDTTKKYPFLAEKVSPSKPSKTTTEEEYEQSQVLSSIDPPKSLESITSPIRSDCSFEYISGSPEAKSFFGEEVCNRKQQSCGKTNAGRPEDESDNDSAVSSSPSSIERSSPPASPHCLDFATKTNHIRETDPSKRRSWSESNQDSQTFNKYSNLSSRFLNPQSVEAINRKNILASAKCRSGKGLKIPFTESKISSEESHKQKQKHDGVDKSKDKTENPTEIVSKKAPKELTSYLQNGKDHQIISKPNLILNKTSHTLTKDATEKRNGTILTETNNKSGKTCIQKKSVQSLPVKDTRFLSKDVRTNSVKDLRNNFENIGPVPVFKEIFKHSPAKKIPTANVDESKLRSASMLAGIDKNISTKVPNSIQIMYYGTYCYRLLFYVLE